MSIGKGNEEGGEVDTAETVQRRVQSPGGTRSAPRAQNGACTRPYLWGASNADGALDTPLAAGDAGDFLRPPGEASPGPGGAASTVRPTTRATQRGVGRDEKKRWTCRVPPSGRCSSPPLPSAVWSGHASCGDCPGRPMTTLVTERAPRLSTGGVCWPNRRHRPRMMGCAGCRLGSGAQATRCILSGARDGCGPWAGRRSRPNRVRVRRIRRLVSRRTGGAGSRSRGCTRSGAQR